jgi:hypothetical protein
MNFEDKTTFEFFYFLKKHTLEGLFFTLKQTNERHKKIENKIKILCIFPIKETEKKLFLVIY